VHVAFVTHAYPRWPRDVAGNFLHRLATALVARGHRVSVIAPADRGAGGVAELDRVTVRRVRYAGAARETLAYAGTMVEAMQTLTGRATAVRLVVALARALRELRRTDPPDVVHAHWWIPGGIAALLAGAAGRPLVVTLHGTDVRLLQRNAVLRRGARLVLGKAAVVSAVSSDLADRTAELAGVPRDRVVVQPMPAAVEGFARRTGGGDGVLTVGRLSPQKRTHLIVDAVAALADRGRAVPLTVIGDGAERSALEARTRAAGCEELVRFLGAVSPDDLPDVMGNPDVFAFAGLDEGLGLAVAEAYFLGIPVVAMRGGGGVVDLLGPDPAGRIVPDGDISAFADALRSVIDDPATREAAAAHGDQLRRTLGPDAVARHFETLYRNAMDWQPA
jgi:glycosyltransferase involved in cell wall biosynthesis